MNLYEKIRQPEMSRLKGVLPYLPILAIVFLLALGGGLRGGRQRETLPGAEAELPPETEERATETEAPETEAAIFAGEQNPPEAEPAAAVPEKLAVYVCGYVRCPGVYEVEASGRVLDAVNAAGGFLDEADTEYWNLAELLTDGEQIRIPSLSESETLEARETLRTGTGSAGNGGSGEASSAPAKVNLNTADARELMTLNGIGASRAAAILAYREENGPFRSIEEIMNVSGIKEASFAKIKDCISVG